VLFPLQFLWEIAVFGLAVFVVGAATSPASVRDPLLRFMAGIGCAFGLQFALGFVAYALGFSNRAAAVWVAAVALALIVARRRGIAELWRDRGLRQALGAWAVFAAWSIGLLALVHSYSGGGWVADWVEHWQRTRFFFDREPLTTRFAVVYALPARPPLANLVIALWLEAIGRAFWAFQLAMTLFGTLIVFPLIALARRWRRTGGTDWWVVLLLMLNPLVGENVTFAWTKLPTAFFVLSALTLASAATLAPGAQRARWAAVGLLAGLGAVTHYSALPWLVAITLALIVAARPRTAIAPAARAIAAAAVPFVLIVGLWLGWVAVHFGYSAIAASTSTQAAWAQQPGMARIATAAKNIFDTVVPFPLRGEPADGLLTQASRVGRIRDVAFNIYQLNLPLAVGISGVWMLAWSLTRPRVKARAPASAGFRSDLFWWTSLSAATVLGIVAHTPRDAWGLTHICLQPLVLLALAWLSGLIPTAPRAVRSLWAGLALVDFAFGVVLHFSLEAQGFASAVVGGDNPAGYAAALSRSAVANASDKAAFGFQFLSDRLAWPLGVSVLWLALCAAAALAGTVRVRRSAYPL